MRSLVQPTQFLAFTGKLPIPPTDVGRTAPADLAIRPLRAITLTMDNYGHLFPGQEADAVDPLRQMLADDPTTPEALRAMGTVKIETPPRASIWVDSLRGDPDRCELQRLLRRGGIYERVGFVEEKWFSH